MTLALITAFWIIVLQILALSGLGWVACTLWGEWREPPTPSPSGDDGVPLEEWVRAHRVTLPEEDQP
jgi:hypothetical protein